MRSTSLGILRQAQSWLNKSCTRRKGIISTSTLTSMKALLSHVSRAELYASLDTFGYLLSFVNSSQRYCSQVTVSFQILIRIYQRAYRGLSALSSNSSNDLVSLQDRNHTPYQWFWSPHSLTPHKPEPSVVSPGSIGSIWNSASILLINAQI